MNKVSFFRSIRFQIPIMLSIAIIIPLLLLFRQNIAAMNRITLENSETAIQNDLSSKALSVDYVLNEITQFAQVQASDAELRNMIKDFWTAGDDQRMVARSCLTLELGQRIVNNPSIDEVFLIIEDDVPIVTTLVGEKEISPQSELGTMIYQNYQQNMGKLKWSSMQMNDGKNHLVFYRPINDDELPPCMLIFTTEADYFEQIIEKKTFASSGMLICDYTGRVMFQDGLEHVIDTDSLSRENAYTHPALSGILSTREKDSSYQYNDGEKDLLIEYYSSSKTIWKYIEITNLADIYASTDLQSSNFAVSFCLGILVSILGAWIISLIILQPMDRVLTAMRRTEQGDFREVTGNVPKNEMGVLITGYNHMVDHLKRLIDENYVKELSRKEAQLRSVQSQIDEHFLYNTLNTIYCVSKQGDNESASEMLVMLSKFFRINLSEGRHYIQVSRIIELIKAYLWIQKMRYGNRLNVSFEVDPAIEESYAVKYLFQPVVENAVVHGLEDKVDGGQVDIIFRKNNERLYFETKDNGKGMDAGQLENLRRTIANPEAAGGENFALRNISEQIYLAYGERNSIKVESIKGEGTSVSIDIPLLWEDPDGK